jgi:hypothetical protein
MRWTGVAVVLAAATVGLVSPAGAATPVACRTSGLVVWLDTQGNGAAGSIYYRLMFTNLGGRACTLRGYPGVSASSLAGRQLGGAALRDPAHASRTITLRNGASAVATLRIAQAANYPANLCRATTAAGLRVYPPNETVSKTVPFPFRACTRPGAHVLFVQAVQLIRG